MINKMNNKFCNSTRIIQIWNKYLKGTSVNTEDARIKLSSKSKKNK